VRVGSFATQLNEQKATTRPRKSKSAGKKKGRWGKDKERRRKEKKKGQSKAHVYNQLVGNMSDRGQLRPKANSKKNGVTTKKEIS